MSPSGGFVLILTRPRELPAASRAAFRPYTPAWHADSPVGGAVTPPVSSGGYRLAGGRSTAPFANTLAFRRGRPPHGRPFRAR
eukprot:4037377-Lingulodinium_polyedra.AAC.1